MIAKFITVYVRPGHMDRYLAAQRIWNRETLGAPGYVGHCCWSDPDRDDVVHLQFFWRSRDDLDRWMRDDHDRIATLADADAHYERIDVQVREQILDSSAPTSGLFEQGTPEDTD